MSRSRIALSVAVVTLIGAILYFAFRPSKLAIDVSAISVSDTIELKAGPIDRTIFVFEQPHCSFCQQLGPELDQLKNTRVLIVPVAAHGDEEKEIAKNAWCSSDRAAAWRAVNANSPLPPAKCDASAIDRNLDIAHQFGLTGTPTVIFKTGQTIQGFTHASAIQRMVDCLGKTHP